MVKIILKGGLGNQMFQYAAAKSLALEKNTGLILDLSFLENRIPIKDFTRRSFELDLFKIEDTTTRLLNNKLINNYLGYPIYYFYNRYIKTSTYIEGPNYYAFDPKFLKSKANITIEGYFNNPKYFAKYEETIKNIFDTDKLYDPKYKEFEDNLKNYNSVSINIRRGDYMNKKNINVFTYLGEEYYSKAIEIVKSKISNPHFFVFSHDDPRWFESAFNLPKSQYTMVSDEYIGERFKTYLRLISLCKHNIISNSSFAWWGAYLNKSSNKIVISPKKWMYKYDFDVPPEWITIDNK